MRLEGEAAPALEGEITADVAIVGGGFTGLWTALALKARKPSLSIALIEAGLCGCGASGKNGGKAHGYWASLSGHGEESSATTRRWPWPAREPWRRTGCVPSPPPLAAMSGGGRRGMCASLPRRRKTPRSRLMSMPPSGWACPTRRANFRRPKSLRICKSPVFRGGVFLSEGANVHPARLARALRKAVIEAGVQLFENSADDRPGQGLPQPRAHRRRADHCPRSGAGDQLRIGGAAADLAACHCLFQLCGDERARARQIGGDGMAEATKASPTCGCSCIISARPWMAGC